MTESLPPAFNYICTDESGVFDRDRCTTFQRNQRKFKIKTIDRISVLPNDHQFVFIEAIDNNNRRLLFKFDIVGRSLQRIHLTMTDFFIFHPITDCSGYILTKDPTNPLVFIVESDDGTVIEISQDHILKDPETGEAVMFPRLNFDYRPVVQNVADQNIDRLQLFIEYGPMSSNIFGFKNLTEKAPVLYKTSFPPFEDENRLCCWRARIGDILYTIYFENEMSILMSSLDLVTHEDIPLKVDCSLLLEYPPVWHFPLSVHSSRLFLICTEARSSHKSLHVLWIDMSSDNPKWEAIPVPNHGPNSTIRMAFHNNGIGIAVVHATSTTGPRFHFYRVWSDISLMTLSSIAFDRYFNKSHEPAEVAKFGVIRPHDWRFPSYLKSVAWIEELRRSFAKLKQQDEEGHPKSAAGDVED
uniref:F-box associated domain-containing protein n=1 Tax=Panagrellus redivivus TaxID=6233 RepID=A0A7E4VGY2_PANRE